MFMHLTRCTTIMVARAILAQWFLTLKPHWVMDL
jgi:hypothetical protein